MQLSDFTNLLQKYSGASANNPPADVNQDFQQVAQNAPSTHLANGLADAFNSDQTPPFGQMIGSLFGNSNNQQRAGILNQLIAAAGPSILSSGMLGGLAGGLGGMLGGGGAQQQPQITPEQASQISPEAVQQMAEHAHRANPSIVEQASNFYAQHPTLVQSLGAGSLALIMSRMSRSS